MTRSEVSDKAAFVREALEELDELPQESSEVFFADRRNLPTALHWLQTAIQALIDIGLILVSAKGLPAPRSSSDMLESLESAGALPAGTATRYRPVIGFRNRIVHLYDRIDPEIVFRIVTEDRGDLAELLRLLLEADASA